MAIGIQARTSSTRLRGKILEKIGNRPIINHVINACRNSESYINRALKSLEKDGKKEPKIVIYVETFLLIPEGDAIKNHSYGIDVIEGSEEDVLSRYMKLLTLSNADYIVRITSDCPLIPPYRIAKAINVAVRNNLDYVSNVDEDCRTAIDGHDVEVISKRCLEWVNNNAVELKDREHVTTFIRHNQLPSDFEVGVLIDHTDFSHIKHSVDTVADLEKVREEYSKVQEKINKAELKYGRKAIHRI